MPNPNSDKNVRSTKRHRVTGIKFNIVLYIKIIFVGQGVCIQKAHNRET